MLEKKINDCILKFMDYVELKYVKELLEQIKKYNTEYENDLIDIIIVTLKKFYDNKFIDKKSYDRCLEILCDSFKGKSKRMLEDRIEWLYGLNLHNTFGICKNHFEVYKIFDEFNKLLYEANIEHYYTSGILSYLLVNKSLERYHHDLDVFVNEEELEKLERISNNYQFSFIRKLGDRPDGTQRRILKMYYKEYDIPITVFMYSRQNDGVIIQKDYFYDADGTLNVEEIYNSKKCAELSFSEFLNYHNNIPYKSITLEALYLSKTGCRVKDIYDCSIILPYLDNMKLRSLEKELKHTIPNNSYIVVDEKTKKFINGNSTFVKKI